MLVTQSEVALGADPMSWYLPVPQYADEATGTTWRVSRAWFDK
jgi:hypothetical protein